MLNRSRVAIGLAVSLGAVVMFAPVSVNSAPFPLSKTTAPTSLVQEARVVVSVGPRRHRHWHHHRHWRCWWHRGRRVCGWRHWY